MKKTYVPMLVCILFLNKMPTNKKKVFIVKFFTVIARYKSI